ncbi:MAG: trypsin-like peptidase domain-containing protein [Pseudomonadota bacterium]|nr:trypsin-like peptidase domain-containing protein [Pseudomonadota bacterium]
MCFQSLRRLQMLSIFLSFFSFCYGTPTPSPILTQVQAKEKSTVSSQSLTSHVSNHKKQDLQQALAKSMPAVVTLEVMHDALQPPRSIDIKEPYTQPSRSFGSGFFISDQGFLITNAHVIHGAKSILIKNHSGNEAIGQVVGVDTVSDLAVLHTSIKPDTFIDLNSHNDVYIGEPVYAIGNAFDLAQSVSYGIVSALHRAISNPLQDFIQTDSAINQGNSGGPLINSQGELVGVNTMIITTSGGNNGVGFAIPLSIVRSISQQIIEYGNVKPSQLGVHVQNISSDLAQALGSKENIHGVLISDVMPNSSAESLKLQPKDIITTFNEEPIVTASQLAAQVYALRENSLAKIDVLRNGKPLTFSGTLLMPTPETISNTNPFHGTELKSYEVLDFSGSKIRGLQINQIQENSSAWVSGLLKDDVIIKAGNNRVENLSDIKKLTNDKSILLEIIRLNRTLFLLLKPSTS